MMKQFLITYMLGSFLTTSLIAQQDKVIQPGSHLVAKCKTPPQGPPGPRGPAGKLASHYASVWSTTAQELPADNTIEDVIFENDQVTPVGIIRPIGGNDSQFQIKHSGIYLIIWNVTASYFASQPNTNTAVNFTLFNVTAGTSFNPGFNGSATLTNNEAKTITGQTTVFLPAGTIIQLQVQNERTILQILNRTLTITQIADK